MPCLSQFYGISVYVNYRDHAPPHVHAYYGEFMATFLIENGQILAGEFPARAARLMKEWIDLHKNDLHTVWEMAVAMKPLPQIEPLP